MSPTPLSPPYSPYPHYYSSSPSQSYEEESKFSQLPPENPLDFESENKRSRLSVCGGRRSGVQTPPPIATTTQLTWVSSPMSHNAPICDEHEEVSNLHEDDEAVEEQDCTYVPFTFRHCIHPQPALSLFDANGKRSASSLDLVAFALSGESGARLACSCKTPSSATPLSRAHPNIV